MYIIIITPARFEVIASIPFVNFVANRIGCVWLACSPRVRKIVSEWSDMPTRGMLFQGASTIKNQTQRISLEQSGTHHHLIEN